MGLLRSPAYGSAAGRLTPPPEASAVEVLGKDQEGAQAVCRVPQGAGVLASLRGAGLPEIRESGTGLGKQFTQDR